MEVVGRRGRRGFRVAERGLFQLPWNPSLEVFFFFCLLETGLDIVCCYPPAFSAFSPLRLKNDPRRSNQVGPRRRAHSVQSHRKEVPLTKRRGGYAWTLFNFARESETQPCSIRSDPLSEGRLENCLDPQETPVSRGAIIGLPTSAVCTKNPEVA